VERLQIAVGEARTIEAEIIRAFRPLSGEKDTKEVVCLVVASKTDATLKSCRGTLTKVERYKDGTGWAIGWTGSRDCLWSRNNRASIDIRPRITEFLSVVSTPKARTRGVRLAAEIDGNSEPSLERLLAWQSKFRFTVVVTCENGDATSTIEVDGTLSWMLLNPKVIDEPS